MGICGQSFDDEKAQLDRENEKLLQRKVILELKHRNKNTALALARLQQSLEVKDLKQEQIESQDPALLGAQEPGLSTARPNQVIPLTHSVMQVDAARTLPPLITHKFTTQKEVNISMPTPD